MRPVERTRLAVKAVQVQRLDVRLGERHHQEVRAPEALVEAAVAADILIAAFAPLGHPDGLALRLREGVPELAPAVEAIHRRAERLLCAVAVVDDVRDVLHHGTELSDEPRRNGPHAVKVDVHLLVLGLLLGRAPAAGDRLEVGIVLDILAERDAKLHVRHDALDLRYDRAPVRRNRLRMRVEVRLITELEAGDNALVAVLLDPGEVVDDAALHRLWRLVRPCRLDIPPAPLLESEERLEVVLLEERKEVVRIDRQLDRIAPRVLQRLPLLRELASVVALLPPSVCAPLPEQPRARLAERTGRHLPVRDKQVIGSPALAHHTRIADDRRRRHLRDVADDVPVLNLDFEVNPASDRRQGGRQQNHKRIRCFHMLLLFCPLRNPFPAGNFMNIV